jgi:hypothetical protein
MFRHAAMCAAWLAVACGNSHRHGSMPVDGPSGDGAIACGALAWTAVAGSPAGVGGTYATTVIAGTGPTDIWTLGATGISRGDGTSWSAMPTGCDGAKLYAPTSSGLTGFWVAGTDSALATSGCVHPGDSDILHWDGSAWQPFSSSDNRIVNAYWGSSIDDVWGATTLANGYAGHWDGSAWTAHVGVNGLLAGGAVGDLWGADGNGLTHFQAGSAAAPVAWSTVGVDATTCFPLSAQPDCLHSGWGGATDDVWFVGDDGVAIHFDGTHWASVPTSVSVALRGVWGTSQDDVWAVGDGGTILHEDGTGWTAVASPTTNDLYGVWASGPCDIWALGDAVYHAQP